MTAYTDYVTCDSTSAKQNGSSAATVKATFTGKKFTPNYVRAWLQQKGTSYSSIETFTIYVAQADAVSATVGGGNKTIQSPTIASSTAWALQVADTSVATASVQQGNGTSRTVTITPKAAGTTTIDVRSGSSTYSTSNPLRQRITVTVTGGGTPTPTTPKETWTQTFQMPMCADYYAGSGDLGAEKHTFTQLTTNPSGNWILTSEGSPAQYIGISANRAAAKPTLQLWPSAPGYVSGTIVDPGNASNFADFGITLTYRKEETVPLLTSGRTSVQKACTYSGVYKTVSDGTWTVTSTDASVATVEGVSGYGKEIHPVITALKAGTTTVTVKNTYATYVYNVVVSDPVARPVDIVFTNEVRIAQRSTQTLTNDVGTAIAWNGAVCRSSDENVVKVIQADGYVAVSNTLYDGSAQVDVSVPGTNYHFIVRSLTISLEKTVLSASVADPNNKSNATIRITSHVLHGVNTVLTNRILFLSSVCTSHDLEQTTIVNALNVLKTKGNVDWYLYGKYKDEADEANKSGTLKLNGPNITTSDLGSSFAKTSHSNLRAYLTQLDASLDYAHLNYAYVVLSFDGTRLASYMTSDDPDRDRRVAEKLAWYYENNRVIWIIDTSLQGGPYDGEYYRPNSAISSGGWGVDQEAWEALVAMLDPATYLANPTGSRYTATAQDNGVTVWAATRNTLQVPYDNSNAVTAYLNQYVREANYDVSVTDKVLGLDGALSIAADTSGKKVRFYTWAGAGNPEASVAPGQSIADLPNDSTHWKIEPNSSYMVNGDEVRATVSNIVKETWNKYEIDVVDNGSFIDACLKHDPPLAVRDPETGLFTVNPNDGPAEATVSVTESEGTGSSSSATAQATATAETTVPWEVEPDYPVEIVIPGEFRIYHDEVLVLTNDVGEAIRWADVLETSTTDENISQIVEADGSVAVHNQVYDGLSTVKVKVRGVTYVFKIRALTIRLEKTVLPASAAVPGDKSNATIRVTSHTLFGVQAVVTNKILFLGSMCTYHGFTTEIAKSTVNTLATKGRVDWYLYGLHRADITCYGGPYARLPEEKPSGTVQLNQTVTDPDFHLMDDEDKISCNNLKSYLTQLDASLDTAHQNYDYVVLAFDANLLAGYYDAIPGWEIDDAPDSDDTALNLRVAQKLRWYYDNRRVIWLHAPVLANEPLTDAAYTPNSAIDAGSWGVDYAVPSGGWLAERDRGWEAFVAVVDPATYLDKAHGSRYVSTVSYRNGGKTYTVYVANRYDLQVAYDDAEKVGELINDNVQIPSSYDLQITDNVLNLNESLSLVPAADGEKVHLYVWAGDAAPETFTNATYRTIADLPNDDAHWKLEPSTAFTLNGYQVTVNVSNLTKEAWHKFEIGIVDNGTFLQECLRHDPPLATLDPVTGKYVTNPNDGPAEASVTVTEYDGSGTGGRITATAEATAETTIPWELAPRVVSLWITDHADAGDGKVHLQFEPAFDVRPERLADWATIADRNGRIWVFQGNTPEATEDKTTVTTANGELAHQATLRKMSGDATAVDEEAGRIWITVDEPLPTASRAGKIVILDD